MNELVPNPVTGFLDAANANSFTNERKLKFLEIARQHVAETKQWPDLGDLCAAVGVGRWTLQRHLKADPAFKEAWDEITLGGKWKLESKMFELSTKNPMYMFGWLRKHFPEEYNPDHKVTVDHNINVLQTLIGKSKDYTEVVDTQAE